MNASIHNHTKTNISWSAMQMEHQNRKITTKLNLDAWKVDSQRVNYYDFCDSINISLVLLLAGKICGSGDGQFRGQCLFSTVIEV